MKIRQIKSEAGPRCQRKFGLVRMRGLTALLLLASSLLFTSQALGHAETSRPSGLVLLLGVKTYEPGTFSNLPNPCNDIENLEQAVKARGDLRVFDKPRCDLTSLEIKSLIDRFHNELSNQDPGVFGIIYFAGHGVAIDDEVLIFGRHAKVEVSQLRKQLARRAGPASSRVRLVDIESGLSLMQDVSPRETAGNPVIMIIDACRSTPLLQDNVGAQVVGSSIARLGADPDTLIAFSAGHGSVTIDQVPGMSTSPYATALADALSREQGSLTEMFSSVRRGLRSILASSRRTQKASELNALESRVCLSSDNTGSKANGCQGKCVQGPGSRSSTAHATNESQSVHVDQPAQLQRSSAALTVVRDEAESGFRSPRMLHTQLRIEDRPAAPQQPEVQPVARTSQQASAPSASLPAAYSVFRLEDSAALMNRQRAVNAAPLRVDVFWCQRSQPTLNEDSARRVAEQLATQAKQGKVVAGAMLSSVRVRRLSESQNARDGYQFGENVIRYSPNDAVEKAWIQTVRENLTPSGTKLIPSAALTPTPGYLSIFMCEP